MKIPGDMSGARIVLKPGEYHVSDEPVILSTLLGSCVSACLYDPVRGIMGMNHFLLSNHRYAHNIPFSITEAGRYGIHAMELLINAMLKSGAQRQSLRAKAFGGGMVLPNSSGDNFTCVGEVNIRFIREFLLNDGIPLVTADLGGEHGRVIYFVYGDEYPVYVRRIRKIQSQKIAHKEKKFWQMSIAEHTRPVPEADIWL
ncbi:MAG: chemotaxis protein CheD [Syntrophales bacterium]